MVFIVHPLPSVTEQIRVQFHYANFRSLHFWERTERLKPHSDLDCNTTTKNVFRLINLSKVYKPPEYPQTDQRSALKRVITVLIQFGRAEKRDPPCTGNLF